jgi:hypothetical protein
MKPCIGVAVETDDVGQHRLAEHRRAAGFFFKDDLQQDAARQVFVGLGIAHHKIGSLSITSWRPRPA